MALLTWLSMPTLFPYISFPVHLDEGDLFVLHYRLMPHARTAFEDPARHPESHG